MKHNSLMEVSSLRKHRPVLLKEQNKRQNVKSALASLNNYVYYMKLKGVTVYPI